MKNLRNLGKTSKIMTGLLVVMALCLNLFLPIKAQAAEKAFVAITLLSASTATNSSIYDISPCYHHKIQFIWNTTNVNGATTNQYCWVRGSFNSSQNKSNWFIIASNNCSGLATETRHAEISFTGYYKYIYLDITNSDPVKTNIVVGTNTVYYYGGPIN